MFALIAKERGFFICMGSSDHRTSPHDLFYFKMQAARGRAKYC